jgi:DNA-binding IclR family transcriptional regulator
MAVKTTERSLETVDTIQVQNGATLSNLESELDIARSTLHKHLQTLISHGYVTKEGETYNLGLKFFVRGEYARTRKKQYKFAAEAVQDLAALVNH